MRRGAGAHARPRVPGWARAAKSRVPPPGPRQPGQTGPVLPTPFAERVLDLVTAIPEGRVLTYGDVAARLGEGHPRAVGTVLARYGGAVPWWRVVRADGAPAKVAEQEAARRLLAEGVPLEPHPDGPRVAVSQARWTG